MKECYAVICNEVTLDLAFSPYNRYVDVGWLVNNLLWLTQVISHWLKMTRKNLTKTGELAVLGSTVS